MENEEIVMEKSWKNILSSLCMLVTLNKVLGILIDAIYDHY